MTDTPLDIQLLDQWVTGRRHAEERAQRIGGSRVFFRLEAHIFQDQDFDGSITDSGFVKGSRTGWHTNHASEKRCAVCGVEVSQKWFSTCTHIKIGIYYCEEHHTPLRQWAKDKGVVMATCIEDCKEEKE